MSKKLSGAEFRKRAKEREKEAHQSSSLMSSWLSVKDVTQKGEILFLIIFSLRSSACMNVNL